MRLTRHTPPGIPPLPRVLLALAVAYLLVVQMVVAGFVSGVQAAPSGGDLHAVLCLGSGRTMARALRFPSIRTAAGRAAPCWAPLVSCRRPWSLPMRRSAGRGSCSRSPQRRRIACGAIRAVPATHPPHVPGCAWLILSRDPAAANPRRADTTQGAMRVFARSLSRKDILTCDPFFIPPRADHGFAPSSCSPRAPHRPSPRRPSNCPK